MNALQILVLSSVFATSLHAGNTAATLKFEEGERFTLSLSSLNFNRIDVEGERIVKVSFPEHSFIVEQSKESENDLDGAVVLKPLAHIPLTVYFTTNLNHHFSATVSPTEDLGKTIKLVSKKLKGFDYAKVQEQSQYQQSDLMTALMEGTTPSGFQEVGIKPATFRLNKQLKVTLVKQYRGKESSGYVYRIENQSSKPMELTPTLFEHSKLITMELSEKMLQPSQTAYFYGIYREQSNIG
ncbi:TPA: type-F conjugative transfer system secretin TraK [Legionella pneumophila]|uniref:Conjugative transfer protein TraK n=2 Tax=Legionella TaxID=445 RepID=A0A378PHE4_9GAMM|nr:MULTISPECIES: type-F conjugative transfer system secretin TraK [Legionella]MCA0402473.1 type-F conjugative transfer system secretin TraK [Pseudomonadota bacterium]KTD70598.1 putative conjugative transfer protein TraK [Legionella steigerwaltii]MBN9228767.1 type-F conjugative transfer system secretin TraK [Legionella steelei]MCL9684165.1 type-F conjugative transfer system secretin TraK [Legionella maioricensis]MCL9686928.1 type-F conjugative transfer system secretin TraK [Legionella maioricen